MHTAPLSPAPDTPDSCSVCGQRGASVPGQTVKALLAVSLRQLRASTYRFCATPDCPVVYFVPELAQHFTVLDVREVVYQKAREDARTPVCYCFDHTVGEIRDAMPEALQGIIEDITEGIRQDQCACDLRNPQGSCCLGNVRKYLRPQV